MTTSISALTTVVGRVFRPATVILGRLRYAQKFALIGLVLLAPLAFVVNAYVTEKGAQIAFSVKERVGAEYMTPAAGVLADLVEAREAAASAPDQRGEGDPGIAARLGTILGRWKAVSSGVTGTCRRSTRCSAGHGVSGAGRS